MKVQSGILRTVKDKDHPYRTMNIAPLQDRTLSWEARGLLAFLLSKPDNWQVRVDNLLDESPKCKRDKLQRILRELEDAHYIVRMQVRKPDGRFEWESVVSEVPQQPIPEAEAQRLKRRRRKTPQQENPVMEENASESDPSITGKTITGKTVDGKSIDGKPAHIKDMDLKTHGGDATHSRTSRSKDENQNAPAVLAYYEVTGIRPNKVQAELIAHGVDDLGRWREVVTLWMAAGWNKTSVDKMLDRYHKTQKVQTNGHAPDDKYAALRKIEAMEREYERQMQQEGGAS